MTRTPTHATTVTDTRLANATTSINATRMVRVTSPRKDPFLDVAELLGCRKDLDAVRCPSLHGAIR